MNRTKFQGSQIWALGTFARLFHGITHHLPQLITMKLTTRALNIPPVNPPDGDGLHAIETWTQAPTPSLALPYGPSMVTWKRGLGESEAKGMLEMESALREHQPDFYRGRPHASLAVIRAYQVLHRETEIPKDMLDNFNGGVPDLKGVHYYSLTQIVRSGPDCSRMVDAMEQEAKAPYVTQLAASFTATYTANNKTYAPTRATRTAVRDASFVSAVAAEITSNLKTSPVGDTADGAAAPPSAASAAHMNGGSAKRHRAALFDTPNSVSTNASNGSVSSQASSKPTRAAFKAAKKYMETCQSLGEPIDPVLLSALYDIQD